MNNVTLNVTAYLRRIGYDGPLDGSAAALAGLQQAHLCAVPYENLDILAGKPLSLETDALYDKIVTRRRGGFCFELNGLFGWLLEALGYPVTHYFARFLRDEPTIPMRRHRVLRVVAEGEPWLCDAGVGGPVPLWPLRLAEGLEQPQGNDCYRLMRDSFLGWVVEEWRHGAWSRYYSFTEEPQLPVDFMATSFYCEYSPASPFNKEPMVALRTPEGRLTLDGRVFKRFTPAGVTVTEASDDATFDRLLLEYFGLAL